MSDYSYLAELYRLSLPYSRAVYVLVFIIGGGVAAFSWWAFAQYAYEREQAALTRDLATGSELDRLSNLLTTLQGREPTIVVNVPAGPTESPAAASAKAKSLRDLAGILLRAEELERMCVKLSGSKEVEDASLTFFNEVAPFLARELGPDVAARFKVATSQVAIDSYPFNKLGLYQRIRGRKEFLAELLQDLRK